MLPLTVTLDQTCRVAPFVDVSVIDVGGSVNVASVRVFDYAVHQTAFVGLANAAEHLAAVAAGLRSGRQDGLSVAGRPAGRSGRLGGTAEKSVEYAARRLDGRWVRAKAKDVSENSHS